MALTAPALPTRFPCWCRAVYSWGGETKRDLGFIEGDLIECLNAGDGSWWMGRLRRDKRMCGLFPSNFVEVLDESFRPSSPLPGRTGGGSISRAASPNPDAPKAKSKSVFRKPFQAYAAAGSPNPEAARRDSQRSSGASDLGTPRGSVKNSHKPYSAMKRTSNERSSNGSVRETPRSPLVLSRQNSNLGSFRAASPAPPRLHSRAVSPAPPRSHSRAVSPSPYDQYTSRSRTASPLPAAFGDPDFHSRAPSPAAFPNAGSSPPPPPPPPHRVAYQPSRVPSPEPFHNNGYNQQSAIPPSPTRSNCSPSPLTQAMNGVMDSLQDMSMRGNRSSSPPNNPGDPSLGIWSPEAFDQIYASSARKARPATSVGVGMKHKDSGYGSIDDLEDESRGGPPQLSNYVQRMESRLRQMHQQEDAQREDVGPPPPRKNSPYEPMQRPQSFYLAENEPRSISRISHKLSKRKSAYELGRAALNRTFTHKSSSTNATSSTQHSLMSGSSAGAFSATSAGSLARRKFGFSKETDSEASGPSRARPSSAMNWQDKNGSLLSLGATSGMHDSRAGAASAAGFVGGDDFSTGAGLLGGLAAPSPKKRGFLKKLVDGAKTGAASARSTISSSGDISGRMSRNGRPQSRAQSAMGRPSGMLNGITGIAGGTAAPRTASGDAARDMGLGGGMDWVQTRRDVNRSNTLSRNERQERSERAQMLDLPALAPVDILEEDVEGDEGLDGLAVPEPTDFVGSINLNLVDKSARFVANLPVGLTAAALAQGYVCRPYRSDVQRLRAIFTWVSERIGWEEEYDVDVGQPVDTRQIVQSMRGSTKEIAHLVAEMCAAVGLGVEVVHGYLKTPGEELAESMENATVMHPNHWWNAVLVDGEWRIMDAALANPSNPKRGLYSVCPSTQAEGWYFLTRPMESCYTHVPGLDEFQHIVPLMDKGILLALPGACPPYFKHGLRLVDYDTSLLFLENLEMAQIQVESPEDVECVAELEVREFARDMDGDFFESGEVIKKPALCQAEWYGGIKRWIIKAVLPGDEGRAVLKIYAGKRGLMHSIKSNPHPLALALPITHTGNNPPYTFLTRHPTPHAQRHDLYVAQPQCGRLAINNTFVFTIRQHPSSVSSTPAMGSGGFSISRPTSAMGASIQRPSSAMSMTSMSVSVAGSAFTAASGASNTSSNSSSAGGLGNQKPAKLAIQSPSGKILRVTRKSDAVTGSGREVESDGSVWETVIKVGERGTWRGLVLADRSARWCVFGEWECF